MNFRELVTRKAAFADKGKKPRTFAAMAKLCGISRPHLYSLFYGQKTAPAWTVVNIAKGLKVSVKIVEAALELSRRQADPKPSKPGPKGRRKGGVVPADAPSKGRRKV